MLSFNSPLVYKRYARPTLTSLPCPSEDANSSATASRAFKRRETHRGAPPTDPASCPSAQTAWRWRAHDDNSTNLRGSVARRTSKLNRKAVRKVLKEGTRRRRPPWRPNTAAHQRLVHGQEEWHRGSKARRARPARRRNGEGAWKPTRHSVRHLLGHERQRRQQASAFFMAPSSRMRGNWRKSTRGGSMRFDPKWLKTGNLTIHNLFDSPYMGP